MSEAHKIITEPPYDISDEEDETVNILRDIKVQNEQLGDHQPSTSTAGGHLNLPLSSALSVIDSQLSTLAAGAHLSLPKSSSVPSACVVSVSNAILSK